MSGQASSPVLIHVDDVVPGMFLRVQGCDGSGSWVDLAGFVGWPCEAAGLVAVPVAATRGGSPTVVLVAAGTRLEVAPEPAGAGSGALRVDLGVIARVDWVVQAHGGQGRRRESWDGPTVDQVDVLVRTPHVTNVVVHTRNWRGQR